MKTNRWAHFISRRTAEIVSLGALVYACIHVLYGILITTGLLPATSPHIGVPLIYFSGALWLLVAWWQYKDLAQTLPILLAQFGSFYLLSALYLVGVGGIHSPLLPLWSLLIITSGLYFGRRGYIASGLFLIVLAASVIISSGAYPSELLAMLLIEIAVVLFISGVALLALLQSVRDQSELDLSHAQAARERDQTTTLVNNLTDAVLSADSTGKIILYNAALLNLLDTNADLAGKHIDDIIKLHDSKGNKLKLAKEFYDSQALSTRDDIRTTISGEEIRLELTYSPIRSSFQELADLGNIGGFIIILQDITKEKSLEEERDEFISVVSHELRTPITIAEGTVSNAQLMLERDDIAKTKIREAVDIAHNQVVFLARMVNDLSTLSRAERGAADEPEDIDLTQMIQDLYHEYEAEAHAKDLRFDIHLPAKSGMVHASRLYLKELLQNFVTNAIKYTRKGSIKIDLKFAKDNTATIAVTDSGIGISKADQKRIFEKFYRAEDYRTRETSGTGLGLYVAVKLARKLGTTIGVKSRLNHGSTFSITLPLIKAAAKKPTKS